MQGVRVVGACLVEGVAWSTLRLCRKTSVDAGRRVEPLCVVLVCMSGGEELEDSWLGMLLLELGLYSLASPVVGGGNPGEGLLLTSSPHKYRRLRSDARHCTTPHKPWLCGFECHLMGR